ncbi:MAG: Uncharacterised protein [Arcobacter lacus]|nr:MAG: Uncharacterised protein [Arcobacter lacus]
MKIEFRKVPQTTKELEFDYNSVRIEGTFCKISQSLTKIEANMSGTTDIDCCRCGQTDIITLDENLEFLISDGIFKGKESEDLVIEVENGVIDFDEIVESELQSIKSDYYLCENCSQDSNLLEQEF